MSLPLDAAVAVGIARSVLRWVFAIVVAAVCLASPTLAAEKKKAAFVVGINTYDNLGPDKQLKRAINDARAVGKAFSALGFEVTAGEELSRERFNALWQKFLDKIGEGDIAAIYFSGHGVEIEDRNHLLPRDVPYVTFGRQEQIKRESLSVAELLLDLRRRRPRVTLLILDACRDNPLIPPEYRAAGSRGGLAHMAPPEGTFIMYSAGAGEMALDRLPGNDPDNVNSIYTRRLLPLLRTPNLPLQALAVRLKVEVQGLTATVPHTQRPAYYDGLSGNFCVAGAEANCPSTTASASQASEAERTWPWIEDTTNQAVLENFAKRFGDTEFGAKAQARLEELRKLAAAPPPPATKPAPPSPATKPPDEPKSPAPTPEPVVRGGSWYNLPRELRSAARNPISSGSRSNTLGFRAARTLD